MNWFSPADGDALRTVRQCSVDTACIAVNGIDSDLGFTSFKTDVAVLSAIIKGQTRWWTVVGDHSKQSTLATNQICTIESVDILLNDFAGASDATAALYQERGVEIRRASRSARGPPGPI